MGDNISGWGTGAPMQNLAHSASFESLDKDAPSKAGTKHLGRDPAARLRQQALQNRKRRRCEAGGNLHCGGHIRGSNPLSSTRKSARIDVSSYATGAS